MTCKDVMTRNPKCCLQTDKAIHAARLMRMEDVGALTVCGKRDGRRLLGMVTVRDLVILVVAEGLDPNRVQIASIMSRVLVTCGEEDRLEIALTRMERNQIRRIAVLGSQGSLAGIISQADIATRSNSREKRAELVAEVSRPT